MSDYEKYALKTKIGQLYDWVAQGNPPSTPVTAYLNGRLHKYLLSQGNPFRNGHYISGGNFISVKYVETVTPGDAITVYRPSWGIAYKGAFTVAAPGDPGPNAGLAYINQRYNATAALGARAWNMMRPDNPDFSLATSLGELKDAPGMFKDAINDIRKHIRNRNNVRKSQGKSALSHSGQFYLAMEFGWIPLLGEIRKFIEAQKKGQDRLAQLIRDNGRPIRRTARIDAELRIDDSGPGSTYASGSGANISPSFVTQCYGPGPSFRRVKTQYMRKTWAEGCFRYHLPPGPRTVAWKKKMLRRLMGARVTPDVVYNLMPWSWLADYFTDLGQFIKATSPGVADRLAADYAYVMRTEVYTSTREASGMFQGSKVANAVLKTATTSSKSERIEKFRSKASPFGWGVNQNSLTPKQWAILGALGLSKLP
jgi:hypothetical protein